MYEHKEIIGTVIYGLYWAVVAYAAYIGLVRKHRPAYQRVAARNRGTSSERGQGLVEYALIMVLVAVVVIGVLAVLGPSIKGIF
jgi:pilus assembly protein Flp/PilA